MNYGLYNEIDCVYLTHPTVGIWHTEDLSVAEDMLQSCKEYVRSLGFDESKFYIIDLDNKKKVQ